MYRMKAIAYVTAVLCLTAATAQGIPLGVPADGTYVVDLAKLLESDDIATLNAICDESQIQRGIPIYIVTIESMAAYGAPDSTIEQFAWDLFEQWGVEPAFSASPNWRQGILLLVSKEDREARIELGMDWHAAFTGRSVEIMEDIIVPAFKAESYPAGIAGGVRALAQMDPTETPVAQPKSDSAATSPLAGFFWLSALMIAGFALLYGILVFVASKITRGETHFIERATSDRIKQQHSGAAEYTPIIVPAIDPNTTTYTSPAPDYYDTSSSSGSSSDSGGSFSDGGGASGTW